MVFVVGSPRSGTTFLAGAVGSITGFVDLTEVTPIKAAIPALSRLAPPLAAPRIRTVLERVRLLALARGLRGVEQTPETAYVLEAALTAYPQARALHIIRDGRDVACSLLDLGWLSVARHDADDAGLSYGSSARFWVESGREREFVTVSDATRVAWAWRRYVTAARSVQSDRVLEAAVRRTRRGSRRHCCTGRGVPWRLGCRCARGGLSSCPRSLDRSLSS